MSLRLFLAGAVWLVPAALLACGGDKDSDTAGATTGPAADALDIVDLGAFAVSDTGAFTGDVVVDVPSGASSVMAWCGGYGDPNLGRLWYLTDPGGSVVFDADTPGANFRSEWLDDLAPAVVPIAPALPLTAGTWTFNWWIGGGNPGSVDCGAVIRTSAPGAGEIAVDLVFVGVDGLDAATAESDAGFQDLLTQFESEWNSGGLTPIYRYSDFTGDVTRFAVVDVTDDDYSEFNDLLRTTSDSNPRRITFFLVEEIANASAGGATILGLSAGPPGAAGRLGTSKSGVIVSAIDWDSAPTDVAKIMAHEGGHFLGLYHTSEKDGATHDPLPDTPQCDISNDGNSNGVVNSDECVGKGAENVMWWTLTSGTATLSGDQGWVVARNPVVD